LFVGFAGDLVVSVWVGRDDDKSLGKISGGTVPARIWHEFMSSAVSIDGTRGPALPAGYRERPRPQPQQKPKPPVRHPSPLPEQWSEDSKPLRDIAREIQNVIEER
jgi:penicillin-binding protein 1A